MRRYFRCASGTFVLGTSMSASRWSCAHARSCPRRASMGSYGGGTRPCSPLRSCHTHARVVKRRKVVLTRWMLEVALATPPPVCLLILSVSDCAWLIRLWKEPQAAGQQVVWALSRVRQSLPRSPGVTRMKAGEHMQQTWGQSHSPSGLTQRRPPQDVSENRDGPLNKHSLIHIVCVTDASSGWTAAGEEQGEATPCQR